MSNAYGFDFLKAEHTLSAQENGDKTQFTSSPTTLESYEADVTAIQNKPDLEKQYDILAFLQKHRGSGCLAPSVLYKATGIDLTVEPAVAEMLQNNPKVRVELVPDPENPSIQIATYAYQAKYSNVRDGTSLLAQINRMPSGLPMRDLLDSYIGVEDDINDLITAGDVIAIKNNEDRDKILFPRGEAFLVELDGILALPKDEESNGESKAAPEHDTAVNGATPPKSSMGPPPRRKEIFILETDMDPREQIRRGEAVQVGGQWFRVSSAVREGVPLHEQPPRAQAPLSVVSLVELSDRNKLDGYVRQFTGKLLPLDGDLSGEAQNKLRDAKAAREKLLKLAHGRSGGVVGQLLGSNAHASNPTTLASSFAGTSATTIRKRPAAKMNSTTVGTQHSSAAVSRASLEKAAADPALALYSHAWRHGCTKDVREMYLATRDLVPESDADLQKLLVEHKLLEPGEKLRRARLTKASNTDNDGKPRKRRYYERKNQRMTNTHLEGTEIGAVLARAAEKQKQGKSVGDGGM